MELWIRTQDKETILKTDRLDYDFSDGHHRIMVNTFETLIAEYKTRERALEVLDEIHKCILDKNVLNGCNNLLTLANKNTINEVNRIISRAEEISVYEMPKE